MKEVPKEDVKIFDVKIENRVAAFKDRGLVFSTQALVQIMMHNGVIANYIVEGEGPTLHHAQQQFCEKIAGLRRVVLQGKPDAETPNLTLVDNDKSPA